MLWDFYKYQQAPLEAQTYMGKYERKTNASMGMKADHIYWAIFMMQTELLMISRKAVKL